MSVNKNNYWWSETWENFGPILLTTSWHLVKYYRVDTALMDKFWGNHWHYPFLVVCKERFMYSKKATKMWKNFPIFLDIKGQLILKCPFGVIFSTKLPTFFLRISALASERRLNKEKIKALYFLKIIWLWTFFDLTSF